jgi:hypothetical protein
MSRMLAPSVLAAALLPGPVPVLATGAVPLDLLGDGLDDWIAARKAK